MSLVKSALSSASSVIGLHQGLSLLENHFAYVIDEGLILGIVVVPALTTGNAASFADYDWGGFHGDTSNEYQTAPFLGLTHELSYFCVV